MNTLRLQHLLALLTVFAANLPVANALTFTNATTISEANTTYDGQDVIVDGVTVTINGPHGFNSVLLTNGAVLTHSPCTTTATHKLELIVTNEVVVTSNSKIDVSGKGYAAGRTTGNTTVGAATGGSSASHGGQGIGSGGGPNGVYGDYADPNDWGAGSLSQPGGGLVRLVAGALNLQGQLLANGGSGVSCGAGGGIRIDTGALMISGAIQVRGGTNGTGSLGGGGGRVAVYAQDFIGLTRTSIVASGGDGPGGAGTILVRDTDEPFGTLTIDNGTGPGNYTPLARPGTNFMSIPDLVVVRGSATFFRVYQLGLVIEFQQGVVLSEAAQMVSAGGTVFLAPSVITGGSSWTVNGDMTLNAPLTLNSNSVLNASGALTLNVPMPAMSNSTITVGVLTSSVPQTLSGWILTADRVVTPGLVLTNVAVLTCPASTASQMHKLEIEVAGTLTVSANSKIDVTGKGYLPGRTTGNTTVDATQGGSSGSYGGSGVGAGGAPNHVYGDYADPNDWGTGSVHLPGGGLVRLIAGTLNLQGQLLANGGSGSGLNCGAGGGIRIDAGTLMISGVIQVRGGTGNLGGGGGRVAVYAQDFIGLIRTSIVALGGDGPARGGAGTIYVRDTDEPFGSLIIDNGTGLGNATPLGLPGTNFISIPDFVVIRGSGTVVRPEYGVAVVQFQQSVQVSEAAQLVSDGTGFEFLMPLVITGGASWTVNGSMTLNVPLTLSNATMTVSGALTSTVPQVISGGTLTVDRLVAPGLLLTNSAVLTCPASTASQMHKLEIEVVGTLAVSGNSKIDVTGKGYVAGRTMGNTTNGAATGNSGGSYGGAGANFNGLANRIYGDYADPEDWGAGGASFPGGGLLLLYASSLQVNGSVLANGVGGGGAGGGIRIVTGGLSGIGRIQAAAGLLPASGGGGRITLYASDWSGFDTNKITAEAGTAAIGGTVHLVSGPYRTHIRSFQPSGINGGFVGNEYPTITNRFGYVANDLSSFILTFNQPLDTNSWSASKVAISGPLGTITPTSFAEISNRTYQLSFPLQTTDGFYHFTLFPTLLDAEGFALDQNANGIPGEPDDTYTFTLYHDSVPPRITHHEPAGDLAGTITNVDVWFSETINPATFTTADVTILNPTDGPVGVSSVTAVGLNRWRVRFTAQTLPGQYHVRIGTNIADFAGNPLPLATNNPQPGVAFDASFNLVPVDLGLTNIVVSTNQLFAGDPITISWQGMNRTGVPLLGNWIDGVYLSHDAQWDIKDTFLATVPHTGGLTTNETYSASANVYVPGVLPGNYYVLVRADVQNQEGSGQPNNLVLAGPVALFVTALNPNGGALSGTLTPGNRAAYFTITLAPGENLGLALHGLAASGENELYVSAGVIPTHLSYDIRAVSTERDVDRQNHQLAFSNASTNSQTYYVLVYGSQFDGSMPFNLLAATGPVLITTITPKLQGSAAPAIATLTGAGFDETTSVEFFGTNGLVKLPSFVEVLTNSSIRVGLDLPSWPAGLYDVRVSNPSGSNTLAHAFEVVAGGSARLVTHLVVPDRVGYNIPIRQTIWVEYKNSGTVPMSAPLLVLRGDHGARLTANPALAVPRAGGGTIPGVSDAVFVLGLGASAAPHLLLPGESGRIQVYYLGLSEGAQYPRVTFYLNAVKGDDSTAIDWSVFGDQVRPEGIEDASWSEIVARLRNRVGDTWGSLVQEVGLAAEAAYDEQKQSPSAQQAWLGILANETSEPWCPGAAEAGFADAMPPGAERDAIHQRFQIPNWWRYVVYEDKVHVGGDRSWRNNNPGNLQLGNAPPNSGFYPGKTDDQENPMAIFRSWEIGKAALGTYLSIRKPDWCGLPGQEPPAPGKSYVEMTIEQAMTYYTPPCHEENTAAVIETKIVKVATYLRVPRTTIIQSIIDAGRLNELAEAIIESEGRAFGKVFTRGQVDSPAWVKSLLGETECDNDDADDGDSDGDGEKDTTDNDDDNDGTPDSTDSDRNGNGIPDDEEDCLNCPWRDLPELTITKCAVIEGDPGFPRNKLQFKVLLSKATDQDVKFDWSTAVAYQVPDGNRASPGGDFAPRGGTATIAAGKRFVVLEVEVIPDKMKESIEYFQVVITVPAAANVAMNATIKRKKALGAIIDDDDDGCFTCECSGDCCAGCGGNAYSSAGAGSFDPNDKLGPTGYGTSQFLSVDVGLPYQIRFENKSDATAPARLIEVTDQLDPNLDMATFELNEIKFANLTIPLPAGSRQYEDLLPVTLNGNALYVDVQAWLDFDTRTFNLTLSALDPFSGWYPEDPLVGLLYPNDSTGRGEGSVSFRIFPKAGLPTGTVITNRATIVFDYNDPIDTPLVSNTIDANPPNSSVSPLPAQVYPQFSVNWSGQDDINGSGLESFTIYVSDNGGAFQEWLTTSNTSGVFPGLPGHAYQFYSLARDHVGNIESTSATPDAEVLMVLTNTAPVAGTDTLGTRQNREVSVQAVRLLANDTDADGHLLSLSAVSALSTNGGAVGLAANIVTYTPLPAFTGTDRFTYAVTDGHGGTNVGTVIVAVDSTNAFSLNIAYGPVIVAGDFVVRFAGIPGETYTIEFTDSLVPVNWQKKTNLTAPTTNQGHGIGVFEFRENRGAAAERYYRTIHPAY